MDEKESGRKEVENYVPKHHYNETPSNIKLRDKARVKEEEQKEGIRPKEWEIILKEKTILKYIQNFPVKMCDCQQYLVIRYSTKKNKLYLSCPNYEYGNPEKLSCGYFSYLPLGTNNIMND